MKRLFWKLIIVVAAVIFFSMAVMFHSTSDNIFYNETFVSGMHIGFLSWLTDKDQTEDAGMQIVYQLAKRSIVKVVVKDAVGSGIVWKINDDSIVIVSNKHLLMKDVKARVTFCDGESADAEMIRYSQQYDIGFLRVDGKNTTANILRDIYEAVPVERPADETELFTEQPVLQIGADLSGNKEHFSAGTVLGMGYEPVFNTDVLKTNCYSKAGMSGGGVFDAYGRLLGMVSGGAVAEDAEIREAEVSYSLPVMLIADEYNGLDK